MKPALVSVIVPMFDASRFLRETVGSVLGQTYPNWELLLVDDGSRDETPEIAATFLADSRIRYLRQANAGVSAARNRGFAQSCGEYVAFLDADDVWLPKNLELKVDYLKRNPDIGLVHGDLEVIDEDSHETGEVHCGREGWILDSLLLWDGDNIPAPSNVLFRRFCLEQIGPFDQALSTAADQDLYFRAARDFQVGRLALVLTLYRMHQAGMHFNINRMETDHIEVYRKATTQGLFRSAWFRRRCLSNVYMILAGSWWHEGGRRDRAMTFLVGATLLYPPNILKAIAKVTSRLWRAGNWSPWRPS